MNPFYWFLVFVAVVIGLLYAFAREAMRVLSKQAAVHAKLYAGAYARGGALVAIAVFTSFRETFQSLSPDVAAVLPWYSWLEKFLAPVIAGLAVFVAFQDGTVKKIRDQRDREEAKEDKK